jgi:tRNA (cytidine/uridine-2'-O-)-methyltransferase
MINLAIYKPDIPQNTAAIIRLAACLSLKIHIIEPCSFNLDDSRFKKVAMDYGKLCKILRYPDYEKFITSNLKSRIILMTTKAKNSFFSFNFKKNDIILLGRESEGVPEKIHKEVKFRLKIPINKKTRSLNVATTAAMVVSIALKNIKSLK